MLIVLPAALPATGAPLSPLEQVQPDLYPGSGTVCLDQRAAVRGEAAVAGVLERLVALMGTE